MSRFLRRWNYKTHQYDPFPIPDDWEVWLISDDMNRIVNCASCGRKIRFGDSYTSMEVQTELGFGYPVCPACYKQEIRRRIEQDMKEEKQNGSEHQD